MFWYGSKFLWERERERVLRLTRAIELHPFLVCTMRERVREREGEGEREREIEREGEGEGEGEESYTCTHVW